MSKTPTGEYTYLKACRHPKHRCIQVYNGNESGEYVAAQWCRICGAFKTYWRWQLPEKAKKGKA
jgi:hypothetical protein